MTPSENPGPLQDARLDEDRLWAALVEEPGIATTILTESGQILYANEQAARLFLDRKPEEVLNKNIAEFFPPEWVKERVEILRKAAETDRPVVLRSIWRGRQMQSTIRRCSGSDPGDTHFLVLTRTGEFGDSLGDKGFTIIESKVAELGPLDVLTTRELEVLALLGQGLRIKEIAAMLYRTPKTIDNHRTSIGSKLREVDRVGLARLASDAGLRVSDAALKRIHFEDGPADGQPPAHQ